MDLKQQLTKAESRLGRTIIKLDEVEAENATLRAQLDLLIQQKVEAQQGGNGASNYPSPAPTSTTGDVVPATEESNMNEKYQVLGRKYAELQSSHAKLQSEHDCPLVRSA